MGLESQDRGRAEQRTRTLRKNGGKRKHKARCWCPSCWDKYQKVSYLRVFSTLLEITFLLLAFQSTNISKPAEISKDCVPASDRGQGVNVGLSCSPAVCPGIQTPLVPSPAGCPACLTAHCCISGLSTFSLNLNHTHSMSVEVL